MMKGMETRVKEQKNTTSEDYLDSLLNSIMNNDKTSADSEDLGLFGDSVDDSVDEDDFFDNLENELFGEIEDTDIRIEEEDYFEKEITDAELFDLDDDIMSVIGQTSEDTSKEKKHEIIKDYVDDDTKEEKIETPVDINEVPTELDVDEAIALNDDASEDDLQGLLDVMGIEEESNDVAIDLPTDKKKKKLFGKGNKEKKDKKGKKASKDDDFDDLASIQSDEMLDLSSLGDLLTESSGDLHNLDFSSVDIINDDLPTMNEEKDDLLDDDFGMGFGLPGSSDDFGFSIDGSEQDFEEEIVENKDKKKKGKKKKEKVKKIKEKKPKKASAKPKKEKKPKVKEPDEVIKISKGFVFLLLSLVIVSVFMLIFGGDYYTYNTKVSKATKAYVNQNYSEAYNYLFGLEMKKKDDEELFNQIQTVMFVNRHYEAYQNLIKMDEYEQGLYSLLKGVKMFDKYQNVGRDLNCYDDMQDVLGWIDKGLMETYGLTESQAREMNLLKSDDQLALEVCIIADEARTKAEAEKEAAKQAAKEEAEKEEEE